MMPSLGRARLRFALMIALTTAGPLVATSVAHAKDTEDRRALRLEEVERQDSQNAELRKAAEAARLEAISRLGELLRESPEGDRKAEMMLRLAGLYYEQGKSVYFVEMEAFQKQQDDCYNKAKTAADNDACQDQSPNTTGSSGWYGKAIKLYEAILKGYPRYARADEATFYLGQTYAEIKQEDPALEAMKKLVKLYPTSNFLPDAYIQIGEYYFDHNEAFPALRAYLQAAAHPESPRYAYAKYKLAWCYYNVEEYGKGIDEMKAVVAYSAAQDAAAAASGQANMNVRLEDEALKDLVRFFADAGSLDEAYEYFKGLGKPELFISTLKRLAALYMEQGKFDQAVETYRRLINEKPNAVENPGYQQEIIAALRKMGNKPGVLTEIHSLRTNYGKQSAWWRANSGNPTAQQEADATIEKALRRVATDFNTEARALAKSRNSAAPAAYEQAVNAYYEYFQDYSASADSYNVHYDFGELLYDLKRFDEAYAQYMAVVKMNPKGQYSQFCAESSIFAAEEMVKKEGGGSIDPKGIKVTKDVQPIALTQWEQNLISACKQYADLYPASDKVEVAIYKSAYLLYKRFHFTEAAEQFRAVIKMNPQSENAQFSAQLILDALAIREEYTSLRDTAKAFFQEQTLGNTAFKKEMYDLWSSAAFTVIEEAFKAKADKVATADAYMQFYKDFPDFSKADLAINNAAVYYYESNRVAQSMEARHIIVEDVKFAGKSKYYYGSVAALGFNYERLADFENAAKYYDKLFTLYPAERARVVATKADDVATKTAALDEQASAAVYSSAVLHDALGDWQGAISRYRQLISSFPTDSRIRDTRLTIARLYEDNKDFANAQLTYGDFYTKDAKDAPPEMAFFARLHQGRAMIAQGKGADALKLYKASIDLYKQLVTKGLDKANASTEFVAEMMTEVAKAPQATYLALTIRGVGRSGGQKAEDKAFGDTLKAKLTAYVGMEKTYQEIIDTGAGPWGLASLVAIGRVYENMGDTLRNSQCPYYLSEDQCQLYKLQIADKAFVQTEKAVDAYKLALEKAFELKLYNDDTAFATRRLGELRPDEFPGLFETVPAAGLSSDRTQTFGPETALQ